jgi:helicase
LGRVLPERLVQRIKGRIKEEKENQEAKKPKVKANDSNAETEHRKLTTVTTVGELKTETGELKLETILEIDPHRPDRIIFEGKEIEVTAIEFSLIHLLAQHPEQVMSYDELLNKLWKDEEDAIYNRVSFHISKVRRTILKIIGKSKINKEKVKNIFTVVSKRGVMLKLKADQIKIN